MNWEDKLRKSGFSNGRDWVIEISIAESFIESLLKKQRDICIKIFEDGCVEVPLKYSYEEDARYNYPEREDKIYQGLKNAPEPGEE